jgi:hypothetical protein
VVAQELPGKCKELRQALNLGRTLRDQDSPSFGDVMNLCKQADNIEDWIRLHLDALLALAQQFGSGTAQTLTDQRTPSGDTSSAGKATVEHVTTSLERLERASQQLPGFEHEQSRKPAAP